jgi:hypothetical protein
VFVLFPFATPAQTLDASTIEAQCPDDYFGEITEQSTMPAQIIATERTIEKRGEAMVSGRDRDYWA